LELAEPRGKQTYRHLALQNRFLQLYFYLLEYTHAKIRTIFLLSC